MATQAPKTPFPPQYVPALFENGYSSQMTVEEFSDNVRSLRGLFQFFLIHTPQEPMKMIKQLLDERATLMRDLARERRVLGLVAGAHESEWVRWMYLERWAKEKGIVIPENIINHGKNLREALAKSGVVL